MVLLLVFQFDACCIVLDFENDKNNKKNFEMTTNCAVVSDLVADNDAHDIMSQSPHKLQTKYVITAKLSISP